MTEHWYLEGYVDGESYSRRIHIQTSPFRIGRGATGQVDCVLPSKSLSHVHAELRFNDTGLWVRDTNSSNGTFVNRKRITAPTRVRDGDVIHLARSEFLVIQAKESSDADADGDRTQITRESITQLPRRTVSGITTFRELLSTAAVSAVLQPIISIQSHAVSDFEMLGRGAHCSLPSSPYDLFRMASTLNKEAQLSRLFAKAGFSDAAALPLEKGLFVNLHPAELEGAFLDSLLAFLSAQRMAAPSRRIVVEIHESAVLVRSRMIELSARLKDLQIQLAYDDFGAGQARLLELVDVPCDYLKFDRAMITDIDTANSTRQKLLASLVRMAKDLGIACLAEGVETDAEWRVCIEMGFTYGQGYFFGKPSPVAYWTEKTLLDVAGLIFPQGSSEGNLLTLDQALHL